MVLWYHGIVVSWFLSISEPGQYILNLILRERSHEQPTLLLNASHLHTNNLDTNTSTSARATINHKHKRNTQMSKHHKPKTYRPVLLAREVLTLLAAAKSVASSTSHTSLDPTLESCIKKLAGLQRKILIDNVLGTDEEGALVLKMLPLEQKEPSILDSLGGSAESTKEAYWEACYQLLLTKGGDKISPELMEGAREHMYLNGLMTPEETAAFEKELQDQYQKEVLGKGEPL